MESWVRDRPIWRRDDLLVTLLHDDQYLTIASGKLSSIASGKLSSIASGKLSSIAPGAFFFVGPAGFVSGTVFALRVPF